jgi:glutamyl-tRNA synthetase
MASDKKIRVRFAPSPTGALHVGGARTALFNFLFALNSDGTFLLRIEDTDISRSDPALTEQILRSLRWLGLDWDEQPVHQSGRMIRYREVCDTLAQDEWAYPCFCSADEIKEKREKAIKETGEYHYDRKCYGLSPSEVKERVSAGEAFALRFRVPYEDVRFDDAVRGSVTIQSKEIDDFIILRSDGTPVYQIAVVVDDHDMEITHVIRGDDHLSNTPKQILIYRAMGWDLPVFAHVPMILGADKKRLSKRHGATSVEEYQTTGTLPEALVNFLALLGWSPGDDREIMSLNEMIGAFSLDRISKNPAVFDETKLVWMNAQYIKEVSDDRLLKAVAPFIVEARLADDTFIEDNRDYLYKCFTLMRERMKKLTDFVEQGAYYFKDPEKYDEKAIKKHWMKEGVTERLMALLKSLDNLSDWQPSTMEAVVKDLAESMQVGLGKVLQPARLALTGSAASPGMFELMEVLGKETTLQRLRRAIEYLKGI